MIRLCENDAQLMVMDEGYVGTATFTYSFHIVLYYFESGGRNRFKSSSSIFESMIWIVAFTQYLFSHFYRTTGVTGGVVVGQVASLQEVFGTESAWHLALSAYLLLVVLSFIPYPIFPESPKYLFIVAGKRDQARRGMEHLLIYSVCETNSRFYHCRIAASSRQPRCRANQQRIGGDGS